MTLTRNSLSCLQTEAPTFHAECELVIPELMCEFSYFCSGPLTPQTFKDVLERVSGHDATNSRLVLLPGGNSELRARACVVHDS